MAPKLNLKGIEIEKGTPLNVVEGIIGDKSVVIYPTTQSKTYAGIKVEG